MEKLTKETYKHYFQSMNLGEQSVLMKTEEYFIKKQIENEYVENYDEAMDEYIKNINYNIRVIEDKIEWMIDTKKVFVAASALVFDPTL